MKKLLAIILALILVLGLCACGKTEAEEETEEVSYIFLEETLGVETYNIGFRKDDQQLRDQLVAGIKAIVENGTYDAIAKNYEDIYDYICIKQGDFASEDLPEKAESVGDFTFIHGFDLDYPPYSYLQDDGSVGGFDVEICQAVCEYLGWNYESHPFNWDAKDMELNSGACDCIWSGLTYEGREDDYLWGITYSSNTQGVLVASNSGITTLADLKGKIVGVQGGTSALDLIQNDDGTPTDVAKDFGEIKIYETYTIAYNDLKAGAIDAIAIDMTAGTFLVANDAK